MLRAKTAGIAAVLQSLSGVVFVSILSFDVIIADMQIGFTAELLMLASCRTILFQSCFPSNRRIGAPRQVSRVTLR
jgi:hypothetical protein